MDTENINKLMDEIINDRTVPRNIKNIIQQAKDDLNNPKFDEKIRISNAVTLLDEVSNDQNIPTYTRTQIWNIVSMLEILNSGE